MAVASDYMGEQFPVIAADMEMSMNKYVLRSWMIALVAALLVMPAIAQAIDRDAWRQVDARAKLNSGMTQEQVERVLGKPARIRTTRTDAGMTRDLEYRSGDDKDWMVVNFMDGQRMSSYSVARLGASEVPDGPQKWRTPSNWLKVRPGMSLDQVEAILGKPTAKAYAGGMAQEALSAWLYDINPESDPATGMIVLDATSRVITVMTPLFPAP